MTIWLLNFIFRKVVCRLYKDNPVQLKLQFIDMLDNFNLLITK